MQAGDEKFNQFIEDLEELDEYGGNGDLDSSLTQLAREYIEQRRYDVADELVKRGCYGALTWLYKRWMMLKPKENAAQQHINELLIASKNYEELIHLMDSLVAEGYHKAFYDLIDGLLPPQQRETLNQIVLELIDSQKSNMLALLLTKLTNQEETKIVAQECVINPLFARLLAASNEIKALQEALKNPAITRQERQKTNSLIQQKKSYQGTLAGVLKKLAKSKLKDEHYEPFDWLVRETIKNNLYSILVKLYTDWDNGYVIKNIANEHVSRLLIQAENPATLDGLVNELKKGSQKSAYSPNRNPNYIYYLDYTTLASLYTGLLTQENGRNIALEHIIKPLIRTEKNEAVIELEKSGRKVIDKPIIVDLADKAAIWGQREAFDCLIDSLVEAKAYPILVELTAKLAEQIDEPSNRPIAPVIKTKRYAALASLYTRLALQEETKGIAQDCIIRPLTEANNQTVLSMLAGRLEAERQKAPAVKAPTEPEQPIMQEKHPEEEATAPELISEPEMKQEHATDSPVAQEDHEVETKNEEEAVTEPIDQETSIKAMDAESHNRLVEERHRRDLHGSAIMAFTTMPEWEFWQDQVISELIQTKYRDVLEQVARELAGPEHHVALTSLVKKLSAQNRYDLLADLLLASLSREASQNFAPALIDALTKAGASILSQTVRQQDDEDRNILIRMLDRNYVNEARDILSHIEDEDEFNDLVTEQDRSNPRRSVESIVADKSGAAWEGIAQVISDHRKDNGCNII